MRENWRQWWPRLAIGAILGGVLTLLLGLFFSSFGVGPAGRVPAELVERLGSVWAAVGLHVVLGALFGAVVMTATLPFADDGKALVLRSLLHFGATSGSFALLLWGCRWVTARSGILLWILMLGVLYLLIWLGRWIGWYQEVVQLRQLLGLAPGHSPLHWRETLPYLPFVLLVCGVLPVLLWWVDRTFVQDVPVFSGLLYPYLGLPLVGFCSGLSLGKRQGLCLLYPLACFLCYLPMVFLLFNSTALFHCWMVALPALAGNAVGWLIRRGKQ